MVISEILKNLVIACGANVGLSSSIDAKNVVILNADEDVESMEVQTFLEGKQKDFFLSVLFINKY